MPSSTLPWYVAGPVIGLTIVVLLGLANRRFGVTGALTDLAVGTAAGRRLGSWRVWMVLGMAGGSLIYALAAGAPDAGRSYGWLTDHLSTGGVAVALFAGGTLIGFGARWAGGCTSGHGLTGVALTSRASLVAIATMMATAVATSLLLQAVV
jgi:uncharacterized membrane protein YedE/YeeE